MKIGDLVFVNVRNKNYDNFSTVSAGDVSIIIFKIRDHLLKPKEFWCHVLTRHGCLVVLTRVDNHQITC